MPTTSIGSGASGFIAAESVETLTSDLAKELGTGRGGNAQADALKDFDNASTVAVQRPSSPPPVSDVATVLLSEVATSDLTKLSTILEPAANPDANRILDSLLRNAIQEVAKGNGERAVGYLADYATRDPRRAEALPLVTALEPVRDKIDSMVSRMTVVAKMSAEEGLSRAEQVSTELAGKVSNWDTHADVLLKLAHRLFDEGGYANYSRTAELARLVSSTSEAKAEAQALAASASASGMPLNALANQMMPGINVPYWASPDVPVINPTVIRPRSVRPARPSTLTGARRNFNDLKELSAEALKHLWHRAPLLVIMLFYFAVGLAGGLVFALASRLFPGTVIVALGNFAFDTWAIGFLALVGFGFYARMRYSSPRR